MTISRRSAMLMLAGSAGMAGCSFYREPPPVVIGGTAVSPTEPILAAILNSTEHTRLAAALRETGLDETLAGIGPMTLFAPTDRGFEILRPKSVKAQIEEDVGILRQILLGHIVPARLTTEDLLNAFPQLNGKTKIFSLNKQVIRAIGDPTAPRLLDLRKRSVKVLQSDAIASNGIIHVVDGALLPDADTLVSP